MLVIWDIDNTLLQSYRVYDEAYRLTSRRIIGKEFIMTKNPDGTDDTEFSKMNNKQILEKRLSQLGINASTVDIGCFFKAFDENASFVAEQYVSEVYDGVHEFLEATHKDNIFVVLTSGTRNLQTIVLRKAGIIKYFDIENSFFFGDYKAKKNAIEELATRLRPKTIAHVSDSPSDMKATKEVQTQCKTLAVGVAACALVTEEELRNAGADYVIQTYRGRTAQELLSRLTSSSSQPCSVFPDHQGHQKQ